jgi:hypothetical protein
MRLIYFILFVLLLGSCREMMDETPIDPEQFSVRLLDAIRKEGLYRAKLDTLSNSSIVVLSEILDSDSEKKAFWVNMYNASVQIRLHETPAQFEKKELFFEEDHIKVGSARLSLKDIECGLLKKLIQELTLPSIAVRYPVHRLHSIAHIILRNSWIFPKKYSFPDPHTLILSVMNLPFLNSSNGTKMNLVVKRAS